MGLGAWVEEDFAQEGVVLGEHATCNGEMALEGGARGILMLHYGREHKGGNEGHGEGVGHGFVVLGKGVFVDIESEATVEVEEEYASEVVAFGDDDGILGSQCPEVGKGGTEHGVGADIVHARSPVELVEPCLDAGDVADDALVVEIGNDLLKYGNGVLECDAVDDKVGVEVADFL